MQICGVPIHDQAANPRESNNSSFLVGLLILDQVNCGIIGKALPMVFTARYLLERGLHPHSALSLASRDQVCRNATAISINRRKSISTCRSEACLSAKMACWTAIGPSRGAAPSVTSAADWVASCSTCRSAHAALPYDPARSSVAVLGTDTCFKIHVAPDQ